MKIEKTYVSYDGIRFDNMKECMEHEEYAWDMVRELTSSIFFLDEDECEMVPYELTSLEDILNYIEMAYSACTYIDVEKVLSDSCDVWVINYFGFEIPDEVGVYKYNFNKCEWYKSEQ